VTIYRIGKETYVARDAEELFRKMHARSAWNVDQTFEEYVHGVARRAGALAGVRVWFESLDQLLARLIELGIVEEGPCLKVLQTS